MRRPTGRTDRRADPLRPPLPYAVVPTGADPTLCEKEFRRYSGVKRHGLTWLSLYGAMQLIVGIPGAMPLWAYGPYETPWPKIPGHILNEVCDAPGVTGTRYGPCPGSPGYRMPVRTLPGKRS